MTDIALHIHDLRIQFKTYDGEKNVLYVEDLKVRRGTTYGIIGESGTGKTVLALAIQRLLEVPPGVISSGEILLDGEDVLKKTEKEMQKKYYFVDNGLLNLFLMNSETSLLENMVAVELCRRFGKKNVFFLNAEKEIDFIVPDEKLAIQVSYSIKDETTYNREVPPLAKYAKAHEDWKCLLITYDEEGTEEGIPVVPVWKWLMEM